MMLVILASAMALFRATLSSDDPLFPTDGTAGGPHPVNGVWAALPADCAAPTTLELSLWPKCATPVGFLDGEVAALQKPAADSRPAPDQFTSIARTHYWSVSGTPVVVQVDVPIMFSHSTIYIALQPDGLDRTNGFTAATGWPIGCPPTAVDGVTLDGPRCSATSAAGVRAAAAFSPDPARTYRLVRVEAAAAGAPQGAPPADEEMPEEVAPASPATSIPSTPPTAPPGAVGETPLPPTTEAAPRPPEPQPATGPARPSIN